MARHLILLNGEAAVGKSTFAEILARIANEEYSTKAKVYSIAGILQNLTLALADAYVPHGNAAIYYSGAEGLRQLKKDAIFGRTGREWMIEFATILKAKNKDTLLDITAEQITQNHLNSDTQIAIVENMANYDELEYFQEVFADYQITTIHLDARATRHYYDGERFDGDSRNCVRDGADFVNPSIAFMAGFLSLNPTSDLLPSEDIFRFPEKFIDQWTPKHRPDQAPITLD